MDRNSIKYYISQYNNLHSLIATSKKKIEEYNKQIKIINDTYAEIGACVSDGMPHTPTPYNDKILNTIERKDKEIEKLKKLIYRESQKIEEYVRMYNIISKVIQGADERELQIIKYYYWENKRQIEACYFMYCSQRTFIRLNNKLIEKIENEIDSEELA